MQCECCKIFQRIDTIMDERDFCPECAKKNPLSAKNIVNVFVQSDEPELYYIVIETKESKYSTDCSTARFIDLPIGEYLFRLTEFGAGSSYNSSNFDYYFKTKKDAQRAIDEFVQPHIMMKLVTQ